MDERDYDEYVVRIYRRQRAGATDSHQFLRHLYSRHFAPKLASGSMDGALQAWEAARPRLSTALRQARDLEREVDRLDGQDRAAWPLFNGRLRDTARTVRDGMRVHNHLVVDTGIADVIQDNFDVIAEGLRVDDLPPEDSDALRQAGVEDPDEELAALVYLTQARKERLLRDAHEVAFATELERIVGRLDDIMERLEPQAHRQVPREREAQIPTKEKNTKRRWCKGLSGVGTGVVTSAVDIATMAGLVHMGHAVDANVPGTIQSIGIGICAILMGAGDLRAE